MTTRALTISVVLTSSIFRMMLSILHMSFDLTSAHELVFTVSGGGETGGGMGMAGAPQGSAWNAEPPAGQAAPAYAEGGAPSMGMPDGMGGESALILHRHNAIKLYNADAGCSVC